MKGPTLLLAALALGISSCSSTGDAVSGAASPALSTSRAHAEEPATTAAAQSSGSTAPSSPAAPVPEQDRYVESLAWAPSGNRLAVWCGNACVKEKGEGTSKLPVSEGRTLHLVDLPSGAGRSVTISASSTTAPRTAFFSPKGNLLLTSIESLTAAYKVSDLSELWKLDRSAIYDAFAVSPDEARIAFVDAYGYAEVVDFASKTTVSKTGLHDPNAGLTGDVEWLPTSDRVVLSCEECTPELWGIKGKRIARINVDDASWNDAQVISAPDGTLVATDGDGTVAVFDGTTGKAKAVLRKATKKKEPGPRGHFAALSADGKTLLVARTTVDLVAFDLTTKKSITVLSGDKAGDISFGILSADGTQAAFGGGEAMKSVRVAEKAEPQNIGAAGRLIGFAADGTLLVMTKQGEVVAWQGGKEKWRLPSTLEAGKEPQVALSPDRRILAIADGKVRLIRVTDQKTVTLALEPKGSSPSLLPTSGSTPADLTAVLGK